MLVIAKSYRFSIFLFVFAICINVSAQDIVFEYLPFSCYLGISDSALILGQNQNPAWMLSDQPNDFIRYGVSSDSYSGDFRRPFDPGAKTDMIYVASGLHHFSERQTLAGSFGYRNQQILQKMWTHHRMPYLGNPFLLADSSVGGFRLNGILWEIWYSAELIRRRLYGGCSVIYNVDEEYKTVFPKTQVTHRDLAIGYGLGWKVGKTIDLGVSGSYFDFQESISTSRYTLDQEKTPLFFKVRGMDNPVILRGETSEERLIDLQGYSALFNGKIGGNKIASVGFYGGYEHVQSGSEDGGAYPIPQGRWSSDLLFFSSDFRQWFNPQIGFSLTSSGAINVQSATHPDFKSEIYDFRTQQITGGIGIHFRSESGNEFCPKVYYSSATYKRTDLFNGILQYFPSETVGWSIEQTFPGSERFDLSLSAGNDSKRCRKSTVYTERTDWYYWQITVSEQEFYETDADQFWYQVKMTFYTQNDLIYYLSVKAAFLTPLTEETYKSTNRNSLTVNLVVEKINR
ncbi:MAG: hypothetical protein COT43_00265 [Candidatus Marinimicrobia bacterium CG08_land_8_20_14_0_20_45_22]|nr:MAG: hypothetical protein COT43_00265 [Candidatus Marinimicrobia bacterium CG08_land_8_20_14_0_20_45_22]